jgi:hypothetical protein
MAQLSPIIAQADPIAKALERRRGGQPTPIINQQSGSAPGQQPPQNPNVPVGTSSPMPDTLASMARMAGESQGGQSIGASPPKSETELIVRALMDRLKALTKLQGGGMT